MKRRGSKWRAKMFRYTWLSQYGCCASCGEKERWIWRKGGISGSFADGDLHQIVWRTSQLELDHIIPLALGGSNEDENLQLLCIDCHKAKTRIDRAQMAGFAA